MNSTGIKKWHPIFISVLIGFTLGMVFDQWNVQHCLLQPWGKRGFLHRGEKEMKTRMLEHMSKELHLSEKQKKQVAAIFEDKRPQMIALHAEMRSKFEALRNETQSEIRKLLTPVQQKKADKMEAEMEKYKREHGGPFNS